MASKGGNFGLQDFANDVLINFGSDFLHKDRVLVSHIHKDLVDAERDLTRMAATSKMNTTQISFVLAKVGIYGENADDYLQLHQLTESEVSNILHFRSAVEDLPTIAMMTKSYSMNVAPRGEFDGINKTIFDIKVKAVDQCQKTRDAAKERLRNTTIQYFDNAVNERTAILLEEQIISNVENIAIQRKSYEDKRSSFVHAFWHSEARLLFYVQELSGLPACVSNAVESKEGFLKLIILHAHSRFNVCDHCRLQLTGSIYKWMYRKMLNLFHIECNDRKPPKFHLIISYSGNPRSRIDYNNPNDTREINIDAIESVDATDKFFCEETKPFVSIVNLSVAEVAPVAKSTG